MAVALLALFVALGGTGYAALALPKNSVGAKQIKKKAVRSGEIKSNAIGTRKVKPGSLLAEDFKQGQLPQGPTGPAGPAGRDGTPADLQPEPVRLVGDPTNAGCASEPGSFCSTVSGLSGALWQNAGNGYAEVGFRKDSGGWVHLQGMAEKLAVPGPDAPVVFYLPEGYRPTDGKHEFIAQQCGSGSTYVDVAPDGSVTPGANCLSLDGIIFHP